VCFGQSLVLITCEYKCNKCQLSKGNITVISVTGYWLLVADFGLEFHLNYALRTPHSDQVTPMALYGNLTIFYKQVVPMEFDLRLIYYISISLELIHLLLKLSSLLGEEMEMR